MTWFYNRTIKLSLNSLSLNVNMKLQADIPGIFHTVGSGNLLTVLTSKNKLFPEWNSINPLPIEAFCPSSSCNVPLPLFFLRKKWFYHILELNSLNRTPSSTPTHCFTISGNDFSFSTLLDPFKSNWGLGKGNTKPRRRKVDTEIAIRWRHEAALAHRRKRFLTAGNRLLWAMFYASVNVASTTPTETRWSFQRSVGLLE